MVEKEKKSKESGTEREGKNNNPKQSVFRQIFPVKLRMLHYHSTAINNGLSFINRPLMPSLPKIHPFIPLNYRAPLFRHLTPLLLPLSVAVYKKKALSSFCFLCSHSNFESGKKLT
jgi:hypothetical protein